METRIEATPTLSRNQEKEPPETTNAAVEEPVFRWRRKRRRSRVKESGSGASGEDEVERKMLALQKIVPGGGAGGERLFEETAEYIMRLEWQVKVLRALAAFVQDSQNQNRKLGG